MSTKFDLSINQGDDFTFRAALQTKIPDGCSNDCSIVNYDLTNKGVRAQIRQTYNSCEAYEFVVNIISVTDGKFELFLPATVTATMKPVPHVWDVEVYDLTDDERVFKPFYGNVTVAPEVTR